MRKLVSTCLLVAATAGLAVGCGSGAVSYGSLISASYPVCATDGNRLAGYLASGRPTSFDLNWGGDRQQVLAMSGQQQALYIRETADSYISQCDASEEQAAAQASAQASASASASAAASAAAAQQQIINEYLTPACNAVGGQLASGGNSVSCNQVAYYGTDGQTYYDSLAASGTVFQPDSSHGAGTSAKRSECARGYFPDGSAGPVQGTPGHYVYGLCLASWQGNA